jgi:hypothetical protein
MTCLTIVLTNLWTCPRKWTSISRRRRKRTCRRLLSRRYGMGYKPLGTELYLQCRQILQQRTQAQATKVQRLLDNLSRPVTCTTFGDATTGAN